MNKVTEGFYFNGWKGIKRDIWIKQNTNVVYEEDIDKGIFKNLIVNCNDGG